MIAILHDMMHECIENYANDIVVKSIKVLDHFKNLRKKVSIAYESSKVRIWSFSGKVLSLVVHRKGINVNPANVEAI
ncbi:reverse transcriptase [Gossypium australe]|uniref:Reverse transcriptase n=1 Tax=Gossypium australe TaxID=47621 RepID=A0A5B6WHT4_9ROSI|nr:reverse transcriptase [Gossypium australe]